MSRKPREPRILARLTYLHARLLISTAAGIAVTLALSGVDWRTPTKLLAGWDVGVGLYLLLMHLAISGAPVSAIRRRAAIQDEGAIALLLFSPAAALASLAAVVAELGNAQSGESWANLAIGMGTI